MVPVDRDYRQRWQVTGRHGGHAVWTSDEDDGQIHGTIVGVHFESCIGCMKCQDVCPVDVFVESMHNGERVVDPERETACIFCLACEIACPTDAICVQSEVGSDDTLDALLGD
ncbi:4Fe-4S dicluster domain-containing protein [Candidatus Thorarchaeota archaeon]|nr:MAG: 4Fe-4S dicluster domain-containing protein [Candidatus Thorarchaeota archaeon]